MQRRKRNLKLIVLCATIFSWATLVFAFSSGPPAGNTGGPGEGLCSDCHSGAGVNNGGGSVTITGLPQNYVPGTRYNLTVTVADPAQKRWGFQVTALSDSNSFAGSFQITDSANTQMVSGSGGRNYVEHTFAGTRLGTPGPVSFNFAWTAPSSDIGNVTFYVAGNAANGDGNLTGDNIYKNSKTIAAQAAKPAPTLTSITPSSGPASGGTDVTLTGSNFVQGLTVLFGSRQATVLSVSSTQIKVRTQQNDPGTVDVLVTNPDGQVGRLRSGFTYQAAQLPAPTLTSITPNSGPTSGGTTVTITGNNFVQGLTVVIGRQVTVLSVSSTQIQAQTGPNPAGSVDVLVTNPDGQSGVLSGVFTYVGEPPGNSVQLLKPNGGEVLSAGGLPFTITWTQMSGPTATQNLDLSTDGGQTFSTVIASGLTAEKTSFSYAVPAGITTDKGRIRISITENGATISDTSKQDFSILPAPTITAISPKVSSTIKLKITGTLFQSGAVVEVNGTPAPATVVKSSTSIIAKKISGSLIGTPIRVRVHNLDGTISAEMTITP